MSLKIQNLTKLYGEQKAVDNISFDVTAGEIVGFLGPNGAGKSTTMKIATTYLPPTEGVVTVGGYDVLSQPGEVKKIIGYLPEHNPLYLDMYVREYLRFVAKVYGMGKSVTPRVDEMIEKCGLTLEAHKKIEALSKGYRQRVGIAQALIHDPQVLILDEPTTGLDPNQILEIRKLIREVAINKTVIFSTHIMQEVQALCDRVILINKGKIVADNLLSAMLNKQGESKTVIAEFETNVDPQLLLAIEGVTNVDPLDKHRYRIVSTGEVDIRSQIFRLAAERNLLLVGLRQEENSLESIFQQLTS
jgi:ABC-2 type transport system ATP-binding protein